MNDYESAFLGMYHDSGQLGPATECYGYFNPYFEVGYYARNDYADYLPASSSGAVSLWAGVIDLNTGILIDAYEDDTFGHERMIAAIKKAYQQKYNL